MGFIFIATIVLIFLVLNSHATDDDKASFVGLSLLALFLSPVIAFLVIWITGLYSLAKTRTDPD